jgi:hypothetical protein
MNTDPLAKRQGQGVSSSEIRSTVLFCPGEIVLVSCLSNQTQLCSIMLRDRVQLSLALIMSNSLLLLTKLVCTKDFRVSIKKPFVFLIFFELCLTPG